jgi:mRNA-degrading endonuclease RelE of RelBE toxin-antitoxin system
MNYSVVLTRSFKRSVKRLEKRFRHVKNDVRIAIQVLLQSPRLGVVVPGTSGMRKLRVRNTDLSKGKREMKTLSDRLLTRGALGVAG